jgi:hypothetical protein
MHELPLAFAHVEPFPHPRIRGRGSGKTSGAWDQLRHRDDQLEKSASKSFVPTLVAAVAVLAEEE